MISSTKNPLVKRIRRLKQKKHRLAEGVCFIEGLRVVATALEMGADVEQLIWCDALLTSEFGRTLLTKTTTTEVSETVFRTMSERENPVGIAATLRFTIDDLRLTKVSADSVFVALNEVGDPGNLGTIIRTADAAGASGVILVGNTVDPYHPSAVKASMGTLFNVPIVGVDSAEALIQWAKENNLSIIATSAKGSADFRANFPKPSLLYMGSERAGLPQHILAQADETVAIPMRGSASSLNLSVATGILLYQLTN